MVQSPPLSLTLFNYYYPFYFCPFPHDDRLAEPARHHELKRTRETPRAVRELRSAGRDARSDGIAPMGRPALVTDVFVPVHVVPRALAHPFARAASLSRAPRDDRGNRGHDSRCQPCDGGFDDPRRI